MRIVLDHNLPRQLRRAFPEEDEVFTARQLGLADAHNGVLLARLEGDFDVLITADKNLRYQQNLTGRALAIIELPTNRWPVLQTMREMIVSAVLAAQPSTYTVVEHPPELPR